MVDLEGVVRDGGVGDEVVGGELVVGYFEGGEWG